MKGLRRVAVIGGDHAGSAGMLLRGLFTYARPDKPWMLRDYSRQGDEMYQIDRAEDFGAEVYVANVYSKEVAARLRATGRPVVVWSHILEDGEFARVGTDDREIGRMGAEYFLTRGYRHFGFAGHSGWALSVERLAGYRERLEEAGMKAEVMPERNLIWGKRGEPAREMVVEWMQKMPKPFAMLADIDSQGRNLCEVALAAGVRVPEDMAVLGVSNHEMLCDICWPPLSSIETPDERVGYEIGRLVERALVGKKLPKLTLLPPIGVVERRSTDEFATDDVNLSAALRVMREQIGTGVNVEEVLRVVPLSRGHLFRLFKEKLGRSPLEEIHRLRCEAAKRLLLKTDLPIPVVATKSGFCSQSHLGKVFRKVVGSTPVGYRRAERGGKHG